MIEVIGELLICTREETSLGSDSLRPDIHNLNLAQARGSRILCITTNSAMLRLCLRMFILMVGSHVFHESLHLQRGYLLNASNIKEVCCVSG